MQAWKNIHTGKLHDIQTLPGPLPVDYNAEDWELTNITEADIAVLNYRHTPRGLAGLLADSFTIYTLNLEEIL